MDYGPFNVGCSCRFLNCLAICKVTSFLSTLREKLHELCKQKFLIIELRNCINLDDSYSSNIEIYDSNS